MTSEDQEWDCSSECSSMPPPHGTNHRIKRCVCWEVMRGLYTFSWLKDPSSKGQPGTNPLHLHQSGHRDGDGGCVCANESRSGEKCKAWRPGTSLPGHHSSHTLNTALETRTSGRGET